MAYLELHSQPPSKQISLEGQVTLAHDGAIVHILAMATLCRLQPTLLRASLML